MDPTQMADNDPQLYMDGGGKVYLMKAYWYVFNWAALANNSVLAVDKQTDPQKDFQLLYLVGTRDNVPATVTVRDGGADGLPWQDNPVNWDNMFGTAQNPFPVGLIPQLLPKGRVYEIVLTNTSGGAINAQACFVGYKLWPQ